MLAAREVGGDFYDVLRLENGRIGLSVADVSDKGVPAALFMMSALTLLKGSAIGVGAPGAVLTEVNDLLNEENEAAMFVTLFYAVFNPSNGLLNYANGGHNPPIIVHPDGTSTLLPATGGIALGVAPNFQYEESSVILDPGDTLVLYTDGVTEAMNAEGEEFSLDRLRDLFTNVPPRNPKETNEAIFEAVRVFAGDTPQSDDITCLACRRSES